MLKHPATLALILAVSAHVSAKASAETVDYEFRAPSGNIHECRLHIAEGDTAVGVTAVLIGGGGITDMRWTVPGTYTDESGAELPLTRDSQPTYDADTLAEALHTAGFNVLQWSSIHKDDPLHAEDPAMGRYIDFWYSVELTHLAIDSARARDETTSNAVVLIGHSLGAPRAAACADDDTLAMVFLAGAYVSRLDGRSSDLCAEFGDNEEGAADIDGDGELSPWECAGDHLVRTGERRDESPTFRRDVPWVIDVLREREIPTLALWGGADTLSIHAPILLDERSKGGLDHLTVEVIPGLDHNMSRPENDRPGPIDDRAVQRVIEFLRDAVQGDE